MEAAHVYVCGNYFEPTDHFAYGVVIYFKDQKYSIKGSINNGPFITMRSVGGGIVGCMEAIKTCIFYGYKKVIIYHKIMCLETLVTGKEKPKKCQLNKYINFMKNAQEKIDISFKHVKSKDEEIKYGEAKQLSKDILGI